MTHLNELADNLREAARAYYDSAELLMSDEDYDLGIEELRMAAAEDPARAADFSDLLDTVAAGQSAGGDVQHPSLMGSMQKVPSLEDVTEFVSKVPGGVIVEPKLDGLAIRAVYTDGKLTLVATRGDGHTGEDITAQTRNLGFLPATVSPVGTFEVRGEVYMRDEDFPSANTVRTGAGGAAFVNPRNAAAGILRKGDKAYAGLLRFAAYDATGLSAGDDPKVTAAELQNRGIAASTTITPELTDDPTSDAAEVLKRIELLGKLRPNLGFPTDGAVIKAASRKDRDALGMGHTAPRWAVAYKYAAETALTKVRNIVTDVGRTGRLSLTVEVEPVFVGGAQVSRASGHNVYWLLKEDIRVGDTVTLRRAGDVIPYVSEVDLDQRPDTSTAWAAPEQCPRCGGDWDKTTLLWRCTSYDCTALGRIVYAVSRDCLDVDGLGDELVAGLVEAGLVDDVADLFTLTADRIAKVELESGRLIGDKVATKVAAELERAKNSDWNRVITALGIRATGRTMGRRLAAAFPTMEQLRAATVEDLDQVDGIARKKAEVIYDGIQELERNGVLDRLADAGVNMGAEPDDDDSPKPLAGETVVVTGKVGTLTRTQAQERIESLGGKASGSVSGSTTLLVADPSATSSKVKKAKDAGVRIMAPEELLSL